ncbi:MAG: sigma-70 family RNA polymerase sigma factor, partial [Actinomycetia bacterium]|nr:sigma-70 family RNA polymerase sigma factor [Actinomycetes bacterium]
LRSSWRTAERRRVQEPITPAVSTPDEQAVINEEHELIVVAIRTLSLKDRELLWLREVLGLDYRSIADRTESNPPAVRVSCHRARQRLQKAFEIADAGKT